MNNSGTPSENQPRPNYRNKISQVVKCKDGSTRIIHHDKKVPNGDYKSFWNQINTSPKPNSKRQKALREIAITGGND